MSFVAGYAGINTVLRKEHIFMSRTCRLATIKNASTELVKEMMVKNLEDLLKILKWNKHNNIKLFRMSSEFAPHITNPELLGTADKKNFRKLAYDPKFCAALLRKIGNYAKKHEMRLTFHPSPFIVLGTNNPDVLLRSKRELYFHSKILDLMGCDLNSCVVLHGGGIYGDKPAAKLRWVAAFNGLPEMIKNRIVIENDEYVFNVPDMLELSASVDMWSLHKKSSRYKIPVVFDTFHYECYNLVNGPSAQPPPEELLPLVAKTWNGRIMKMHISNQRKPAMLGAHSDYVTKIPKYLPGLPKMLGLKRIDIMVEAKMKEQAVLKFKKIMKRKAV
jgi:UV DNA damage endonuclease